MDSCWLIEFTDGHKIIISEDMYKQKVERNFGNRKILSLQHWFDVKKCIERNKGVSMHGLTPWLIKNNYKD